MTYSHYLRVIDTTKPCDTMPQDLAAHYKFPLDPFQQHAAAAISAGENVLVTAKTGSGKTLVGELQIYQSLSKGKRVFYTTPIKSLSNQKFYDLKQMFPSVGIMTGDLKFCPDAQIVIMTTEILRNLLYKHNSPTRSLGITADLSLENLDAVIFDECHYINDKDRGKVWEETMILLPPTIHLVLLSATIQGPEAFASWLGDLKKVPIHLLSTEYRIVPLVHGVFKKESFEFETVMDAKDQFHPDAYNRWLMWRKEMMQKKKGQQDRVANRRLGGYEDAVIAKDGGIKSFPHQMNALLQHLEATQNLPALFFVFSRKDCERYASKVEGSLIDSSDTASVKHILDFHLHRYGETLQRLPQYHALRALLERGVAFHHSGLLPVLKEMVEILFGKGLIKVLFATETFAVGINMPTKTVVFTGFQKYDDSKGGHRILRTDEYIQMAGRAGRRGKDDRGLVVYLPDREAEHLDDMKRMMTGSRAPITSHMDFHYDFLLKTLQAGTLDWMELMGKSYAQKEQDLYYEGLAKEIEALRAKQQALPLTEEEGIACQEKADLLDQIRTTTNAARREAQRKKEAWERVHIGPRWAKAEEHYKEWCRLAAAIYDREEDAKRPGLTNPDSIRPLFAFLEAIGFLDESHTKLTRLGTMATEVNEGHPILMPLVYAKGLCNDLSAHEILLVLAAFLGEGDRDDAPSLQSLTVPPKVIQTLLAMELLAQEAQAKEKVVHVTQTPAPFWNLNASWIEPMHRWLEGEVAATLCQQYGFFEGNLLRTILKLKNLLEEWRCLATLSEDIPMLEKLREVEILLLKDVAATDSLYLRL